MASFAVAAAWSLVGTPAVHAETTCDGLPVTIVGSDRHALAEQLRRLQPDRLTPGPPPAVSSPPSG
ncbi:hypothetical protein [Saccharothrix deserti]|uniref:hypothetical protein n=1 Tax=Saccharothrix deserti TaxID=2593674 RepID=UPI00131ABD73|nr:hypothetical protein [Saccharothrix deserti]